MSDILKGLRTYLISKTVFTDEASSRCYFGNLPQRPTYPAAVLHLIDTETMRDLEGSDGLVRSTVQVDCHANSMSAAHDLANGVRNAVVKHTERSWGSETVRRCYVTGRRDIAEQPVDGSEHFVKVRSLDLAVWHSETAPST